MRVTNRTMPVHRLASDSRETFWRLPLVACLLSVAAMAAQPTTVSPTPAEIQRILDGDWSAACGRLRSTLIADYSPQACQEDAFGAWLNLHRWLDYIARNEFDETARLASRHLRWHPEQRRITVVPTGIPPPTENLEPLGNTQLQQVVRDARFLESVLPLIAPHDFRPAEAPLGARLKRDRLLDLLSDEALGRELFESMRDEDFAPAVIDMLARMRDVGPGLFGQYRALAVAISLVYDQPAPPNWPHAQVRPEAVPRVRRQPFEIFGFWIQCQDLGRLYLDPRTLEVGQLMHLVDAPVRESEFTWAQAQVDLPRYRFAEAFDITRYDQERMRGREFVWPGNDYSLRAILARGGICVDQAYFAMLAGKAKGLPTLLFSGQGPDGGHAWFGFMKRDDTWVLDAGRERNRGEPVGTALNPQTWQTITDHELRLLARGYRDKPAYRCSQRHMAVARLFEQIGDRGRQLDAFRNAIAACPSSHEAWEAATIIMEANAVSSDSVAVAALKEHALAASKQFASEIDIRVRYQQLLADIARRSGDTVEADRITKDIIRQTRGDRADISAKLAWRPIKHLLDSGDVDRASVAYKESLDRLGRTGGGNLYSQVVAPFVLALADRNELDVAESCLLYARKILRVKPLTPLDANMAQLLQRIREGPTSPKAVFDKSRQAKEF